MNRPINEISTSYWHATGGEIGVRDFTVDENMSKFYCIKAALLCPALSTGQVVSQGRKGTDVLRAKLLCVVTTPFASGMTSLKKSEIINKASWKQNTR